MAQRQLLRTTIEYRETDDGTWEAWEAGADNDHVGLGQTPATAVASYCHQVEEDNEKL